MARGRVVLAAVLALALAGCSGPAKTTAAPTPTPTAPPRTQATGTVLLTLHDRQVTLHVPASYDAAKPVPLVMLLHGYTASGALQEAYLKFAPESDRLGFLYAYPDGKVDQRHSRFWNATDACCDLYRTGVDDSGYLSEVIKRIEATYRVDTRRVYLVGHSNGAFMAFRMACDHADQITAVATLNGAMWRDASRCRPSAPVSVLDIRGTKDTTIRYAGGKILDNAYPSATTTEADWVALDRCADTPATAPKLDLVTDLPDAETTVRRYTSGCAGGSTVETWTIAGGGHVPSFNASFAPDVMRFLLSRVKP
jgi:polyhydroxybutyrate depolymerase